MWTVPATWAVVVAAGAGAGAPRGAPASGAAGATAAGAAGCAGCAARPARETMRLTYHFRRHRRLAMASDAPYPDVDARRAGHDPLLAIRATDPLLVVDVPGDLAGLASRGGVDAHGVLDLALLLVVDALGEQHRAAVGAVEDNEKVAECPRILHGVPP